MAELKRFAQPVDIQGSGTPLTVNGRAVVTTSTNPLVVGTLWITQGGEGISVATGQDSTFIGRLAGNANHTPAATDGIYNTFIGSQAGQVNTSGYAQTFLGYNAGPSNTTGGRNTFLGYQSGLSNTIGDDNTFVGVDAGYSNVGASRSVIIGFHAGKDLTPATGTAGNVLIGYEASQAAGDGTLNTLVGYRAGYANTTGYANTALGNVAGFANQTGTYNVAIGESAGLSSTGGSNTLVGARAGYSQTSGSNNTCVGQLAGFTNLTGDNNVFLGYGAGYYETGSSKLFIDNVTRASEADGRVKALVYGEFASTTASQALTINGHVSALSLRGRAVVFASVPATPVEGMLVAVTDSSTAVWGDTITGSGANHVLAYYNGTNWTVAGK